MFTENKYMYCLLKFVEWFHCLVSQQTQFILDFFLSLINIIVNVPNYSLVNI